MNKLFFIFLGWMMLGNMLPIVAQGLVPVGTWRTHYAYFAGREVALSDEAVFCATQNGLFRLGLADNSLEILSNANILSDVGVSALGYSPATATLIVGYENGNLDLLRTNETVNIRTILNTNFDLKTIRHILLDGQVAYLSTGFGLVKLDLLRGELTETYDNIGAGGAEIGIFSAAILNDSLFVASTEGLLSASLATGNNLLDFRSWQNVAPISNISELVSNGENLLFSQNNALKIYENGNLEEVPLPNGLGNISHLAQNEQDYLAVIGGSLYQLNGQEVTAVTAPDLSDAVAAVQNNGVFWVADGCQGLLKVENGNTETYRPNGLLAAEIRHLQLQPNGQIAAFPGGYSEENASPLNRQAGLSLFENGNWQHFSPATCPETEGLLPSVNDATALATLPDGTQFLATFGSGLYQKVPEGQFEQVTDAPFSALSPIRITDLFYDNNSGDLWVTLYANTAGAPSVFQRTADGQWESFGFTVPAARQSEQLLTDFTGLHWLRLRPSLGSGVLVFNDDGDFRQLREGFGNGDLPSSRVNAMVQDLRGSIWIGTDEGVAEFFDPLATFQGDAEAITPIFENARLLRDEKVTALAVDGGNRKWIGTENGLWLFSEDGDELVSFFNVRNSPLPDNRILAITIQPQTGDVFVATEKGVVSYRGTATQATNLHRNVKIFPNPVRPNYQGLITIEGLAYNATIKITDVSGRLVANLQANGGTAVWNGRDYNGNRTKTGIYFVMSVGQEQAFDTADTFVAKFAIIE